MSSPKDGKHPHATVKVEEPPADPPKNNDDGKSSTNAEPLAPPPKKSQGSKDDYFSLSHEPNPFEQSFGQPGQSETPGKSLLPPVASLTSPQSLLPGATPGWSNSLRSGPLSPAMLSGPAGTNDYFGDSFRGGFPTPNESSLRTGLTPGGGGSMFPAPSPGTQAFLNQLQSGGATPSTLDFHRTALNARSSQPATTTASSTHPTSTATANGATTATTTTAPAESSHPATSSMDQSGSDANDAANGLYMLAQANGVRNTSNGNSNQFAVPPPPHGHSQNAQAPDSSPPSRSRNAKGSVGSLSTGREGSDGMDYSEGSEDAKPALTRSRSSKKKAQANGNRRKADETPSKPPANKKAKPNGVEMPMEDEEEDDSDGGSVKADDIGKDGRKMTDEEKRKNFLERNRVAALKCRQRKKQWLANLQTKVEIFSSENDALSATVTQLREEIVNLKTLLLAHKDCPVSQAQGLSGMAMNSFANDLNQHANPYGMAMQGQGMPHMSQAQMAQRR